MPHIILSDELEYHISKTEKNKINISISNFGKKTPIGMYKRIIIAGKMASGKDYLRAKLVESGFTKDVSQTSRPKRANETEGNDYHFITTNKFQKMIEKEEFYEYTEFCNWFYGTTKESWNNNDVFIMNPYGLSHIDKHDLNESFVIYLDVPLDKRLNRLKEREMDYDNVERRISTDYHDFIGIKYNVAFRNIKINGK